MKYIFYFSESYYSYFQEVPNKMICQSKTNLFNLFLRNRVTILPE